MSKERERTEIAEVYLHVGNSGTTFKVSDYYGPTVSISSSSFGNLNHQFEFATTKEGLRAIRDVIDKALKHDFSKDYCHAAKPPCEHGSGCCSEGSAPPGVA